MRTDGKPIPEEWLDAIDARIAYRGPDGHGRFRDRVEVDDPKSATGKRFVEVAFVHRRLSIIDHADGHQPMVSERGRNEKEGLVAVVFNGCIYNHRELRRELQAKGHKFVTDHSDTEVLIHGWREWSDDLPSHLEGMYAFAVWDRLKAAVFLSRDLFGEKPLYVREQCQGRDLLMFGSERDALSIAEQDGNPETVRGWLAEYLQLGFGWGPEGLSSDRPSSPVSAGMSRTYHHATAVNTLRAWSPKGQLVDSSSWEALIDQAVARRLEADVPLGCFLSGGVDSSLVVEFARRHQPDIQTFTVKMPDARYDESQFAQQVAKHLDVRHTTLDVSIAPAEDLVRIIDLLGQPFGDSSILPTYWVSRAARSVVKVALSGDGGDELFLGYDRYRAVNALSRHWRALRLLPRALHNRAHPKNWRSKAARLGDMARDFKQLGVAAMESIFSQADIRQLTNSAPSDFFSRDAFQRASFNVRSAFSSAIGSPDDESADECGRTDQTPLEHLRRIDVEQYLPNDLLTKVDTASMACALEVRCPFLDRDLARTALSMPIDQLIPNGQRKGLLRNIARKYLPKQIVDRPKMGFAIPVGEWFRTDYGGMKTLLLDHLNSTEPFGSIQLNRRAVQRFIDEHMAAKRDHGQRLFTLLTLSIWARLKA
ncbi:MAG: asparagine synthase (glutamine-hydrolyzing) [Phycisphaerales bacterium]|nr:asparagine synthase (glutamine-hydrolyzing) [Phycisphaerales bacterium]